MTELKPCECIGEPEFLPRFSVIRPGRTQQFRARCIATECPASTGWHTTEAEDAIAWNTRTPVSAVDEDAAEIVGGSRMTELKPCPFCGGEARYLPLAVTVQCRSCYCHTPSFDEPTASAAWNRRAPSPSVTRGQLIETMEGIVSCEVCWAVDADNCCRTQAADAILARIGGAG